MFTIVARHEMHLVKLQFLLPFLSNLHSFKIDSAEIKCEDNVTHLGINIDFMLRFDDHLSQICKKKLQNNSQS